MAFRKLRLKAVFFALSETVTSCNCRQNNSRITRNYIRKMATYRQDHVDRTKENTRHEVISPAEVIEMKNLSSTVKMLRLKVADKRFSFKAGQWIDMMIPGLDKVGGYSMTSAPNLLILSQQLHLAVKYSTHPPAYWIHTKCKVGDCVDLRTGGDFFYDPSETEGKMDVMLIAGGVGINPLYSILQHFLYLHSASGNHNNRDALAKVCLLFSARKEEELIFRDELLNTSEANENVQVKLFSTREKTNTASIVSGRRIAAEDVEAGLKFVDKSRTLVYICGPGSFIKAMESNCLKHSVPQSRIMYETWW